MIGEGAMLRAAPREVGNERKWKMDHTWLSPRVDDGCTLVRIRRWG